MTINYHDHVEETSVSAAWEFPLWNTTLGRAGRVSLTNLIASILAAGSDVVKIASSATPQPNVSTTRIYIINALAVNASMLAPTGSPSEGQVLIYRIKDNGVAKTFSWASVFRAVGTLLPTGTVAGKWLYLPFMYNADDAKYDLVGIAQE